MIKGKEDIIEVKPGIYGVHLNLRALWRKVFDKPQIDPALTVAQRFMQIFKDHGVSVAQIPRLVPEVTLDKLRDTETLLPVLTTEVVDKVAQLFKIQRAWLEGTSNRIYDCRWCYKNPSKFFEILSEIKIDSVMFPIVAFCSDEKFDYHKNRKQPLVLCLIEKIVDFGEQEVCRYIIFDDGWDWSYWKSRIQLKAMIRIADQILKIPTVPMYKVGSDILRKIESGYCVPWQHLRGTRLHNIALDDFVLNPTESAVSKESEELPEVMDYIERFQLTKL